MTTTTYPYADRVNEITPDTGLGPVTLRGAVTGFQSFSSAFTSGTTIYYCITDGLNWEIGSGPVTVGSPYWTLTRSTIYASSSGTSAIPFTAGNKNVFSTMPAEILSTLANISGSTSQAFSTAGLTVNGNLSISGVETFISLSDQEVVSQDTSPFREGSWSITASGALYNLANDHVMKYYTHNVAINTSGNFAGVDTTGSASLWVFTEGAFEKSYNNTSVTTGTVPSLWNLTRSFDTNTGNVSYAGSVAGAIIETDAVLNINYTLGANAYISGVTVSVASPAVLTLANHGFVNGSLIHFTTTGSLPTGIATNTPYYVIATGLTTNAFEISLTNGGTAVITSGTQSGVHSVGKIKNGFAVGPFAVATGKTLTVPTGATFLSVGNPPSTTTATALASATTTVNVSAATAPTAGQVLTAINSTIATWATAPSGGNSGVPCFSAYQTSPNSLGSLQSKLSFQAIEFDVTSAFDHTTNFRFLPNVAGYYMATGFFEIAGNTTISLILYKNGTFFKMLGYGVNQTGTGGSSLVYLNGTDYIELWGASGVGYNTATGASITYFQACLITK